MRVVVITGSRTFTDRAAIEAVLHSTDALIVGDCPTGADAIALEVAKRWDVIPHVFVADWEKWARAGMKNKAGPVRNAEMAKAAEAYAADGFEIACHAFPIGESKGTRGCIELLRAAGFEVEVHG